MQFHPDNMLSHNDDSLRVMIEKTSNLMIPFKGLQPGCIIFTLLHLFGTAVIKIASRLLLIGGWNIPAEDNTFPCLLHFRIRYRNG